MHRKLNEIRPIGNSRVWTKMLPEGQVTIQQRCSHRWRRICTKAFLAEQPVNRVSCRFRHELSLVIQPGCYD